MKTYVVDTEALLFWYTHRTIAAGMRLMSVTGVDDAVSTSAELARAAELLAIAGVVAPEAGVPGTLYGPNATADEGAGCHHVLVRDGCNRRLRGNVMRHRCGGRIPANAFVLVGNGVYVASPAYVWVRMAARLSRVRLIRLGCALCARYRLSEDGNIMSVDPVTTPERLAAFVDGAAGTYGVGSARAALPYVAGGAESPTEIAAFLMMCLPHSLGGAGLPVATLNHCIPVDSHRLASVADRPNRREYRIDIAWQEQDCGIEYLGKYHDAQADADRQRMNALLAMGMRVLQIKYTDLVNVECHRRLIAQITTLLGVAAPPQTTQYRLAREDLLAELFGPLSPKL